MNIENFYLGTHLAHWLGTVDIPLFVSHRILRKRKSFPKAVNRWALDSGGFSEISLFGNWTISKKGYVESVKVYMSEIGNLDFAAIQDWMCEPQIIQKTRLSVKEHQARTIQSFLDLKELAPEIPFIPVLQGWSEVDYLEHIEMYLKRNIDLFAFDVVGLGSVCRRQKVKEIQNLIRHLFGLGLKLHGFGVKLQGLKAISECLVSADSMAWSYDARKNAPLLGHTHKNCANCLEYARKWYSKVSNRLSVPKQHWLFY